ncbi:hypothetical protein EDB19DRAFT_1904634 [Suillus lakei]|nr:hypothetical protein EDB19DRAFT_1904634 [Suillus lakei]
MKINPAYAMEIQAQIPTALCAIHNFICIHNPSEDNPPADNKDEGDRFLEDGLGTDVVTKDDAEAVEENNEHEFCQEADLDGLDVMENDDDDATDNKDVTDNEDAADDDK